jgi:N-acetyl-gamma-glutamylphosphate reductase
MKTALTTLLCLLTILSPAALRAADTFTYEGTITGVVCSACKAHVTASLTDKLEGIQEIKIVPGEEADKQIITIVSKKDNLTKDAATQALGDLTSSYQILSLAKK